MEHSLALTVLLMLLPVAFVLAVDPKHQCDPGVCGIGESKDTNGRCVPCENDFKLLSERGTFMTYTNHSCISCYKCDEAELEGEIIRDKCTTRSNAIVVCKPEYFNTGANNSRVCLKCRKCTHNESIWRNCTKNKNTLCRPNTATTTAVPDNESISVINDLSTTATANIENETTISPTSNFNITVPTEANTASNTAVPDNESTSVRNDLSTTATANIENETTISPTSNFNPTTAPEEEGDSSNHKVLQNILSVFFLCICVVVAATTIYKLGYQFYFLEGEMALHP